jgi:biopolymer transport protein ExbD
LAPDVDEDDAPPPQRARKLEETELDMTPMIDMTFQLLIFFLVTFKSDPSGGVPLPSAKYGEAIASKNAIMVSVKKASGDNPPLLYKGKASDEATLIRTTDLKDQEAQLETYFAEETANDPNKTYVLIVAGHDVKYKDVKRVAEVASRIPEIQQLYVAVLEVK